MAGSVRATSASSSVVKDVSDAIGVSFTAVTVIETAAVSEIRPSLTLKVWLSDP